MVFRVIMFSTAKYDKTSFQQSGVAGGSTEFNFVADALSAHTVSLCQGFDAVCTFVNDDVGKNIVQQLKAHGVKLILCRCAGFDNVDLRTAQECGIAVCRVPAYSPYAVAEHAMALLMCLNRKVHKGYEKTRESDFSLDGLVGFDFHGKKAGVLGTGKIGQCFIDIALGFGCEVLCYDVYQAPNVKAMKNVTYVSMEEVLAQCDFISVHIPLLPSTQHMLNSKTLAAAKKGTIIVNTSRGALVATEDMIDAVKNGHIGGYGADVYEKEAAYFFNDHSDEVMQDDTMARLQNTRNIVLTAHQAFLTQEALSAIANTTMNNIQEFVAGKRGKELTNHVLPEGS